MEADKFNRIFDREVKKYEKNLAKEKFVVFPDPQFTIEELINHKMSGTTENFDTNEEKINVKSVLTPEEVQALLPKDVELLDEITDGKPIDGIPEEKKELTDEEKKALYIKTLKESRIRFHPIKNLSKSFVVGSTTVQYGSREVKRELKTKVTLTNITTNQFDAEYRKKRQRKNKMQKASRRLAHKK